MFARFALASDTTSRRPVLTHDGRRVGALEPIRPRDLTLRAKLILRWKLRRFPREPGTLQLDSRIFATFTHQWTTEDAQQGRGYRGRPVLFPTFWRLA